MLAKRIIPCLDVKDGVVVKGVRFRGHEVVGDIVPLAKRYAEEGADELVFYDITASSDGRTVSKDWVRKVAQAIDIPFTVAGGIRSVEEAAAILSQGADKISVNSPALEDPTLISRLAEEFGVQCVVVGIDSWYDAATDCYWVNQYTGEVTGKSERLPFFYTMFRLHRWLLDSRPSGDGVFWGKMVVGVSTLMFVVVLVSGIVIWWPRTKRALKNGLSIATHKGWRRFWYDLHVAGGMYGLLLLLVMALTGLTWSFDWYRTGFYHAFGVEVKPSMGHSNAALNARQHDGGKKHRGAKDEDGRMDERLTHWQPVKSA